MTGKQPAPTILILDDDLGFAVWLGRVLNQAGFQALPASRSEEAITIIQHEAFPRVDLFIVNRGLKRSRAVVDELVSRGNLKMIDIGPRTPRRSDVPAASAVMHRPRANVPASPGEYLKLVRKVLSR